MIVLDASVLIAHFQATDPHHARAAQLLAKYQHHEFITSTVTLAEFLVGPTRTGQTETARRALETLDIRAHGLDAEASWRLAELRAQTGLKLPDCCVVYTAERQPDSLIASFDARLITQSRRLQIPTAD
ncbi:type II toxin-antitoxin system VapC family toxin (plasmid) [Mycolicibacterium fluoranthenivorans]|uniref:Ribonuclease VapC n=1 Tax=Mycolicibacterium fluoranthenivorans TaxID=258505 RepID=A0A7G8P6G3_9MYCO|nr:type II toxin-antitoxin system VapC family toxin [Mycolicibacterium fluoranthenivorans]QNJ89929.1 type II toxin-antitoxin system VapC family toxin [Mycolicibacterium fluoranthenivorans]